ncbi:uncharacterized protein At4g13200, chloroplastic-like [Magnolia sinica]|uniref:uncharacterized protein At4g13200, chloroplastic-like n=1 Tax=Magnolia sinica TaxID=86752 RepID=UPI00265A2852|nr:uncharacterized protein At4g13200, chloroplastic-like [Magnolia sinica]
MRAISTSLPSVAPRLKISRCSPSSSALLCSPLLSANSPLSLNPRRKTGRRFSRLVLQCSSNKQGFGSGENDSKAILDAFFLGKALAEALNERVEATVGEIFSVFGQWQAEQRKQVQDLQEEVFERAKKAKEKAALEAMEEQGILRKSTAPSTEAETPAVPPPPPVPSDIDPPLDTAEE